MELTELEKKVILTLAQRGPMSGYDFHLGGKRKRGNRKALMSSGYWQKIKASLGPQGKGLIDRVHVKGTKPMDDRGRRKDLYWLTDTGVLMALSMGVNPDLLLKQTRRYLGRNEDLEVGIGMVKIFGPQIVKAFFTANETGVRTPLKWLLELPHDEHKIRELYSLLVKYPKYSKAFKQAIKMWGEEFRELINEEASQARVCPRCNAKITDEKFKFCPYCASKLPE